MELLKKKKKKEAKLFNPYLIIIPEYDLNHKLGIFF